ncbi:MAG: phosphoribosyl-ATP diphosphatase [Chloroflexi bacterium]|nr:phosphoribosyl-ATP diphosphatase [Chloroflexota bacterium]MBP7592982.1 phosphoribosyl-ATP diphosphatase [Chloroflexota bacterium]
MTDFIDTLFATIQDRKSNPQPGSYTNSLFAAGEDEIVKKVGEEAVEIILAVKGQGQQRIIEETADLVYHLLVMLAAQDLTWDDVRGELEKRHR